MGVTLIYPVPYITTVEDSFASLLQLPTIVTCPQFDVPPFIGNLQSNGWNCNRCGSDDRYFNLFKRGDIIPFQTWGGDAANPDPLNPSIGFLDSGSGAVAGTDYYIKLEVYDWDCTTVLFDLADSVCSDYWVAFSDNIGPIQTFFLDTSTLAIAQQVFRVKITTYLASGLLNTEIWSEPFALAECDYPYTFLMQGFQAVEDCLRHQYITPDNALGGVGSLSTPTDYYTSWRFAGEVLNVGATQEKELNDNDKVISNKVRTNYQLAFRKIPPYTAEILSAIITSNRVLIDDGNGFEEYEEFSDITKNIEGGTRMFLPRLDCVQICDVDGFSCDK
jgi:hypothetical protein